MISIFDFGSEITLPSGSREIEGTGVQIFSIRNFKDRRGWIGIVDFKDFSPFTPQRVFYTFDVPSEQDRGNHAHKSCHQFLVALSGECSVEFDTGRRTYQVRLDSSIYGIYLPPMVWSRQFDFSRATSLLVLASEGYDEADYIGDHAEFLKIIAKSS